MTANNPIPTPWKLTLTLAALGACATPTPPPANQDSPDLSQAAPGATCTDGVKNGAEIDVDCGVSPCGLCAIGKTCVQDDHCASATCVSSVCATAEPQSSNPLANATGVDHTKAAEVTFARPLDASTVTAQTVTAAAAHAIAGTVSYAAGVVRFAPTDAWPRDATITVTLGTGIKDMTGRAVFKAPFTVSFKTEPMPPLLAHWKLDGDGSDASNNSHALTPSGSGASFSTGYVGTGALILDGAQGRASVSGFNMGDLFSFAGWVKLDSPLRSNIHTLLATGQGGLGMPGFKLYLNSWNMADGAFVLETGDGTTGTGLVSKTSVVTAGQWQHIAATFDRVKGNVVLYVNGKAVEGTYNCVMGGSSVPCPNSGGALPNFTSLTTLYVGSMPVNYYLKGAMDDLRIYQGLLTAADVDQLAAPPQ